MLWKERLVATASATMFGLASLMGIPDSGPAGSVKYTMYQFIGLEHVILAGDPYRPVEGTPQELSALGKRYLAAVKPGNAAAQAVNDALAAGKWPAARAGCRKAVPAKRQTLELVQNGDPAWPRDLESDIALLVVDIENDIADSEACAAASSAEAWVSAKQEHIDSGASDRIRVRLGLKPRPTS